MSKKYIVEVPDDYFEILYGNTEESDELNVPINIIEYHESEPIVMTREQKEAFDLHLRHSLRELLGNAKPKHSIFYPMSENDLARAWLNPELIQIEEPKRYWLKRNSGSIYAYFFTEPLDDKYIYGWTASKSAGGGGRYTDEEIAELAERFPELNFDALEKIEVTD